MQLTSLCTRSSEARSQQGSSGRSCRPLMWSPHKSSGLSSATGSLLQLVTHMLPSCPTYTKSYAPKPATTSIPRRRMPYLHQFCLLCRSSGTRLYSYLRQNPSAIVIFILLLTQLGTGHRRYTPTANLVQTLWEAHRSTPVKFSHHTQTQPPGGNTAEHNSDQRQQEKSEDPNIILIINESLGNLWMQTKDGLKQSPFFVDRVLGDPKRGERSFFYFERAHAVSGITDTAMPGVVMGSTIAADPTSPQTVSYFAGWSMVSELKARNYTTVLYSSYNTVYHGRWEHLMEMFSLFDFVFSRQTLHERPVSLYGMDDRKLTALIENHLSKARAGEKIFAVVLWNNLHYPFFTSEDFQPDPAVSNVRGDQLKYLDSLKMTDDMTRTVFAGLNASERIDSTIVVFAADHGETPGNVYFRAWRPGFQILRVPLWFYIPPRISQMWGIHVHILDFNRDKMVSNLDIIPTLLDMLDLRENFNGKQNGHSSSLINGTSLLSPIKDDRYVVGYQGKPFVYECEASHAFLAYHNNLTMFRAKQSDVEVELIDPRNQSTVSSIHWNALDDFERRRLESVMHTKYPFVLDQLHKCGFSVF